MVKINRRLTNLCSSPHIVRLCRIHLSGRQPFPFSVKAMISIGLDETNMTITMRHKQSWMKGSGTFFVQIICHSNFVHLLRFGEPSNQLLKWSRQRKPWFKVRKAPHKKNLMTIPWLTDHGVNITDKLSTLLS